MVSIRSLCSAAILIIALVLFVHVAGCSSDRVPPIANATTTPTISTQVSVNSTLANSSSPTNTSGGLSGQMTPASPLRTVVPPKSDVNQTPSPTATASSDDDSTTVIDVTTTNPSPTTTVPVTINVSTSSPIRTPERMTPVPSNPVTTLMGTPSLAPTPGKAASIRFTSTPAGASLYIDNSYLGQTPVVVPRVTLGRHSIQIRLTGYKIWADIISVTPEFTKAVYSYNPKLVSSSADAMDPPPFPEGTALILITSKPSGASAYVDNEFIDVTPVLVTKLSMGSHKLEMRKAGYRTWTQTFTVDSGFLAQICSYNPTLIPLTTHGPSVSASPPRISIATSVPTRQGEA